MLSTNTKFERTKDMIGKTYGDLTVLCGYEPNYTPKGKRQPRLLCKCKKGHILIKDAANMRNLCKNKCPICNREDTEWRMDIGIEPWEEKFEVWKPIPGYEDFYCVSNLGRVKSLDRVVISNKGITRNVLGHILPQRYYKNRYLVVFLSKDGKQKPYKVYRLVAEAFIPNPDPKPVVNHKDCNKLNNRAENLEWLTQKENLDHAFINGCRRDKSMVTLVDTGFTFLSIREASNVTGIDAYEILEEVRANEKSPSKPLCGFVWAS